MSKGYSACEGPLIYLMVGTIGSEEETVVVFPNGGYWRTNGIDTVSVEIQKAFGILEQDLKRK